MAIRRIDKPSRFRRILCFRPASATLSRPAWAWRPNCSLADLIASGVEDVSSLAERTNTNEDYLFRVLRVLEMTQIVSRKGRAQIRPDARR